MNNSTSTLPSPPIPPGVDLHDFSFVPIFRTQLFRSSFHAKATDAEWRAGVTLWLKSWDQIPAGSLPDDDVELCRLAEFARNHRAWKRVKPMALHGWYKCSDGRLYHRIVAEGVLAAHLRRRTASEKGKLGASKRWHVIDGGVGNARAMALPLPEPLPTPMPGDSNGQGEGQGELHPQPPQGGNGAKHRERSPTRLARDASRAAWAAALPQIDHVKGTSSLTWAYVAERVDPLTWQAIERAGGCRVIADRDRKTTSDLEARFRDAYEQLAQPAP